MTAGVPTVEERASDREPPGARSIPPFVIALWAILGMVTVSLVAVGFWTLHSRREPLPVYARVPDFSLVDRDGSRVALADLAGEPWIADFMFTRCGAVCPRMTQQMRAVVEALSAGREVTGRGVGIVSISVDPEYDTPEILAEFAEEHGAVDDWHFLTGEVEIIDSLILEGFLLALDRAPPPEVVVGPDPIVHSNRFVLVDGEAVIRGYYDAFDPREIERLLADVESLR